LKLDVWDLSLDAAAAVVGSQEEAKLMEQAKRGNR